MGFLAVQRRASVEGIFCSNFRDPKKLLSRNIRMLFHNQWRICTSSILRLYSFISVETILPLLVSTITLFGGNTYLVVILPGWNNHFVWWYRYTIIWNYPLLLCCRLSVAIGFPQAVNGGVLNVAPEGYARFLDSVKMYSVGVNTVEDDTMQHGGCIYNEVGKRNDGSLLRPCDQGPRVRDATTRGLSKPPKKRTRFANINATAAAVFSRIICAIRDT